METKTQQAITAFQAGDLKTALKLASSFRLGLTREEQVVLKVGYECLLYQNFYRQLGKVPEACVEEACGVFRKIWLNEGATP